MSQPTDPHDDPQGPGDARPTAAQIISRDDHKTQQRLKGKKVLITGATSGMGLETAKALASVGCHLYLPVRDLSIANRMIVDIQQYTGTTDKAQIELLTMDLSSLDSVRKCVHELKIRTPSLNILINNAGVMGIPESRTVDGFETHFGTNHLGHFLLFQLVKDLLLAATTEDFNSRVICLSSSGHNRSPILFDDYDFKKAGYDRLKAYGQSKTANIYLALEIERRYGKQGIHAWAVHPGAVSTNLARHIGDEYERQVEPFRKYTKSIPQGAATTVWAATGSDLEGKGGKYLEDCRVAKPRAPADSLMTGHSPWCYDQVAANRLYEESMTMVGLKDQ